MSPVRRLFRLQKPLTGEYGEPGTTRNQMMVLPCAAETQKCLLYARCLGFCSHTLWTLPVCLKFNALRGFLIVLMSYYDPRDQNLMQNTAHHSDRRPFIIPAYTLAALNLESSAGFIMWLRRQGQNLDTPGKPFMTLLVTRGRGCDILRSKRPTTRALCQSRQV